MPYMLAKKKEYKIRGLTFEHHESSFYWKNAPRGPATTTRQKSTSRDNDDKLFQFLRILTAQLKYPDRSGV